MRKKSFFFMLPTLTVFLVGLYVLQINSVTALAYHTAEAEQTIRNLKEQTTRLETHAQGGMSLDELEALAKELHFQKVQFISYVRLPATTVAQNSQ